MDRRYSPYQRKATKKARSASSCTHTDVMWTVEEDDVLRTAVYKHGGKKWKTIASFFDKRTPSQCNRRWNELQNQGTAVKKPWSAQEDLKMLQLVESHGPGKWAVIASYLPGRNGKQCRERWHNQLNPAIKKGPWTVEEDDIIMEMQSKYGNRWAKITEKLPGRTDNAVKNHWHSSMKAKVKHMGHSSGSKGVVSKKRGLTRTASDLSASSKDPKSMVLNSPDSVTMIATEMEKADAWWSLDDDMKEGFVLPQTMIDEVAAPVYGCQQVDVANLFQELSSDEMLLACPMNDVGTPPIDAQVEDVVWGYDTLSSSDEESEQDDMALEIAPWDLVSETRIETQDVLDVTLLEILAELPMDQPPTSTNVPFSLRSCGNEERNCGTLNVLGWESTECDDILSSTTDELPAISYPHYASSSTLGEFWMETSPTNSVMMTAEDDQLVYL